MLHALTLIGVVLMLSSLGSVDGQQEFIGGTRDKALRVTVTEKQLLKTPSWDDRSNNAPLAARKAIKLAAAVKDTLVKDSKDRKWRLAGIALMKGWTKRTADKWYWLAHFEESFTGPGGSSGQPEFYVVVLMDGTVIKPIIGRWE